jgi:gamma-glutamyl-gamma-aminobutyrate hydrolase PuuD
MKRPAVLVVTRRTVRKHKYIDYVGEFHLSLLIRLKTLPLMVPVVEGSRACLSDYTRGMRGLLLVEGEDIEPKHFDLIRLALRRNLPILGICRGSQLLNVVCGGTLYGDVQKEKKSDLKHIDFSNYDAYRHQVSFVAGSPLQKWYARKTLPVNSYHHQGIRDLAPRFKPMAHADDGLIEGYYDPKRNFVVGLQFHPERMLEEPEGNWHLWKAFGAAVRRTK